MATYLTDSRDKALEIGYAATDWHIPVTYAQYIEIAADWDVKAVSKDGQIIGAAYFKNGETHVSILPAFRRKWLTKGILKELLMATQHTRVTPGHDFMYGILGRLGFVSQADGILVREN